MGRKHIPVEGVHAALQVVNQRRHTKPQILNERTNALDNSAKREGVAGGREGGRRRERPSRRKGPLRHRKIKPNVASGRQTDRRGNLLGSFPTRIQAYPESPPPPPPQKEGKQNSTFFSLGRRTFCSNFRSKMSCSAAGWFNSADDVTSSYADVTSAHNDVTSSICALLE